MVKVINNFLDNNNLTSINKEITGEDFAWYNIFRNRCFVHNIIKNSEVKSDYINFLKYFSFLKFEKVLNFNIKYFPQSNKIINVDSEIFEEKAKQMCLFLNRNNGYMSFVGIDKIPSEENRCVIFSSKMEYFQSTSTDPQGRYIINMSYI